MRSSREFFVRALRRPLKQFDTGTPLGRAKKTWSKMGTAAVAYMHSSLRGCHGFWEGRHPLPRVLDIRKSIKVQVYRFRQSFSKSLYTIYFQQFPEISKLYPIVFVEFEKNKGYFYESFLYILEKESAIRVMQGVFGLFWINPF